MENNFPRRLESSARARGDARLNLLASFYEMIMYLSLEAPTPPQPTRGELEMVKSYKYLGLIMSPFGNFNLARQELKKVALKALDLQITKRNG